MLLKRLLALVLACMVLCPAFSAATAGAEEPDELPIGSLVAMGEYEQDGDEANGKEPVEWIVLDIKDQHALLISRFCLDLTPYHKDNNAVTWETCTLRTWLNDEFYNGVFSEEEKNEILLAEVPNGMEEQYPGFDVDAGNDTADRVFLLSYQEVKKYMKTDFLRCCKPSAALALHGELNNWYTRSPGSDNKSVRIVSSHDGALWTSWPNFKLAYPQVRSINGVRPCVWVNMDPEWFPTRVVVDNSINQFAKLDQRIYAVEHPEDDRIGMKVSFGNYMQDSDSVEPIIWSVLDVEGDYALLLSDKILAYRNYLSMDRKITWEECTLRAWLNNEFLQEAFSEEEIAKIRESTISNSAGEGWPGHVHGGNDTTDYVFLLSFNETNCYLPTDDMRVCAPTASAVKQGIEVNQLGYSSWWLRSAGEEQNEAIFVYRLGFRVSDRVNYSQGVRPALWVSCDVLDQ